MVYDPRIPTREECVLQNLLQKWAEEKPDHVAFVFDDGTEWTWSETLELICRVAAGFLTAGVRQGDHVLSWQPNCKEAVLTWYGLSYIGAVYVPVNIAYKGNLLQHVIQLSNASLMICNSQLAPRLADIDVGEKLTDVILTGEPVELDGLKIESFSDLMENEGKIDQEFQVEPWDSMYIIFTPAPPVLPKRFCHHISTPIPRRSMGMQMLRRKTGYWLICPSFMSVALCFYTWQRSGAVPPFSRTVSEQTNFFLLSASTRSLIPACWQLWCLSF